MKSERYSNSPLPPTMFHKIMYALGQFGWSLANACVTLLVVYFYIPPKDQGVNEFPEFIERKVIILGFTAVGILMFLGTIISAIMDIYMGSWSDKSKFKFGRRRTFLAIAFIPIALTTWMAFFPPVDGINTLNTIWLALALLLFNVALPMYVTPFNGLISELGHTQKDRVLISTLISITWGLGFIFANSIFYFKGILEKSMTGIDAFQLLIGIFCLIAVAMMVLPVIFINEEKFCIRHESAIGNPLQQMMEVLKNHNFRRYTIVEMLYWFSSQFLQVGVPYYVTILMGMDEGFTTIVIIIAAGFAFVCYAPITKFSEKYGKKRVMMFGYLLLIANFFFVSILGIITLPVWLIVVLMVVLNSIPMAIFGILPMALVADIATEEGRKTGVFRAATYFGVKSFAMKIGVSFTNLLFPTLLLLGNSTDNNLGVRLTAIAGLITGLSSALMMRKVIDPEVE